MRRAHLRVFYRAVGVGTGCGGGGVGLRSARRVRIVRTRLAAIGQPDDRGGRASRGDCGRPASKARRVDARSKSPLRSGSGKSCMPCSNVVLIESCASYGGPLTKGDARKEPPADDSYVLFTSRRPTLVAPQPDAAPSTG
jgi:hypothetical protein